MDNKEKNLVRLSELLSILGISAEEALKLIEQSSLQLHNLDTPPVMVDIASFEPHTLLREKAATDKSSLCSLSEEEQEIIATEITNEMQAIIRDAYALAKQWQE